MSITVIIPGSLKDWFGSSDQATCEGKTMGECIDDLDSKFPGFRRRVVDEKGGISSSVMIFLDGQNLRSLDGLATPVKDGDEVSIIPFAAGG
ncbi:MAG: MoaD family protein [Syntrophales bacterium]|nr:MoaD family protein [Syntrophales bacterium]